MFRHINVLYSPVETEAHFDEYFKDPPEFYFHWRRDLEKWIGIVGLYLETDPYKGYYTQQIDIFPHIFKSTLEIL